MFAIVLTMYLHLIAIKPIKRVDKPLIINLVFRKLSKYHHRVDDYLVF